MITDTFVHESDAGTMERDRQTTHTLSRPIRNVAFLLEMPLCNF